MTLLFLCVANSARSQIAEGLARRLAPHLEVYSAGSHPRTIKREAIVVLGEVGIDASAQFSKGVDAVPADRIDTVITLCGEESCPAVLGGARHLHWPLPDPHDIDGFRSVRNELERRLEVFLLDEGVA